MAAFKAKDVDIIDIRRETLDDSILETMMKCLNPDNGQQKTIPTLLLYDERGLRLFEQITYLDEYYLTNSEIEVLHQCANDVARRLPQGSRLIELGSGNLRKIEILLKAFEAAKKDLEYYALDLSISELSRTLALVSTSKYKYVKFFALYGTYDDGLAWLSQERGKPTAVLSMGSSIGNFTREEAGKFLADFANQLGPADSVIVGLDACQESDKVYKAYNDSKGVTEWFYRNALDHANILLGYQAFKQDEWAVEGRYDSRENKHEAHFVALKDVRVDHVFIAKGEKLKLEESYKYSEAKSRQLWRNAGLVPEASYFNNDRSYGIHLLSPAKLWYPKASIDYAKHPVPSTVEWRQLWKVWDIVTKSMIPHEDLLDKPIKLRNNLIFYLGHIPAFADIHMTKATGGKPTDPAYYHSIFERGIDPDVDNPEKCHAHSEIPDTWPPLFEIMDYQIAVRDRISTLVHNGSAKIDRKIARGLWLAYEHEAMHLETFLYMLLQSEKVLPPPGTKTPDFRAMATDAKSKRAPNSWHVIPQSQIVIGLDDPENDLGPDRFFGWDNERSSRVVHVGTFEAQSRPISVGEYAYFLEKTKSPALPASWTTITAVLNGAGVNGDTSGSGESDGFRVASNAFLRGKAVRTVFGKIPLEYVLDWPVMASYDELSAYARWSNGRIPTFEEVRSIYNYAESEKAALEKMPSTLISAVNGHLCNEGVEETPPATHSLQRPGVDGLANGINGNDHLELDPDKWFIDLNGCNVSFANWHPMPITHLSTLCGQSGVGGLWEWTSTPIAEFPGFKPMDLYPGYTADFFDGKHNICLGGSWATVPRIAGRKSFVNWYQRNYPYVWCTARLVR